MFVFRISRAANSYFVPLLLLTAGSSFAQEFAPLETSIGTSQLAPPPPPPVASGAALDVPEWLRWHAVQLRPHISYRVSYGDGLRSRPGESTDTVIQTLSPGILVELGERWRLNYTPALTYYSSSQFEDTLDHSVSLVGSASYEQWSFAFSQGFSMTSEPLIETGAQTDRTSFSTGVTASYPLNTRASVSLGVNQNISLVDGAALSQTLSDNRQWSTMNWLNYQLRPKVGVGIGVGMGYTDVGIGSDMLTEQVQGRVNWSPGDKLSFELSGGVENRQFLDSDLSSRVNPLFGLSASYGIFEQTSLSVSANRAVNASVFGNQVTESTSFIASVRQRLLGKLNLSVSGGYSVSEYQGTARGVVAGREDESLTGSVRLGMGFLKRANAALFYTVRENLSNEEGFDLSSRQMGIQLSYRF